MKTGLSLVEKCEHYYRSGWGWAYNLLCVEFIWGPFHLGWVRAYHNAAQLTGMDNGNDDNNDRGP